MPRIIIAGASEASRVQLSRLLTASGFGVFRLCASEGELRRTMTECEDGIVLVSGMQPDDIAADFEGSFHFLAKEWTLTRGGPTGMFTILDQLADIILNG